MELGEWVLVGTGVRPRQRRRKRRFRRHGRARGISLRWPLLLLGLNVVISHALLKDSVVREVSVQPLRLGAGTWVDACGFDEKTPEAR